MSFCMQVPSYRRLPVEIRQELLSKSINELTVLFLSCNFNKKLQIIQFDDTEIDDRKVSNDCPHKMAFRYPKAVGFGNPALKTL